ncbi:MAG: lipid A export permease/ATP-binding protein MsbA [Candidatus Schekmanbacteria bacterium RBG_16_38_10]|uniref:Lipid A export permease/ATP-binding protein MsbA n=1 Tax=Candidatus Schekmanbacteria bacterium RBG_16_38_10 TaxID=1817879 RepID=A0A1F7RM95_9BACT|nr:MAG: lipid A export permease/ATP-binding protein MsbA [Candidatus Schekmanbacteria bacterium RBG_16_38_10]
MELSKRILAYFKPYKIRIIVAIIGMIIVALTDAGLAYLVKPVLNDVFLKADMKMLKLVPLAIIGLYLFKGVFRYVQVYLMGTVGQRVIMDIRNRMYEHFQRLSFDYFSANQTGTMMSRITNDIISMQHSLPVAIDLIRQPFTLIGLIAVAFYQEWRLTLFALIIMPVMMIPFAAFTKRLRNYSKRGQEKMGDISAILQETLSGIRVTRAFGMEEHETQRFKDENKRFMKLRLKTIKYDELSSPINEFLGSIGIGFVIWYGGHQVLAGESSPGAFFSFLAACVLMYNPIKKLNSANAGIQESMASAERVFRLLDTEPSVKERDGAIAINEIKEGIEFNNVSFRYQEEIVLMGINLKVKSGEVVAVVGESGGGKSTLVSLIPRFYDVTDGRITFDGVDIRDLLFLSIRRLTAVVSQETFLFNDTIRNNIAYLPERESIPLDAVVAAAKAANAHDFISAMPEGYNTVIGERGIRLSGGQKQRLSIARALLKNAPILILDEATSSLDAESEYLVQEALNRLMVGRTTLVIAHRLSTIQHADRILVLSRGSIVEEGRHDELLKRNGEYARLYNRQFAKG